VRSPTDRERSTGFRGSLLGHAACSERFLLLCWRAFPQPSGQLIPALPYAGAGARRACLGSGSRRRERDHPAPCPPRQCDSRCLRGAAYRVTRGLTASAGWGRPLPSCPVNIAVGRVSSGRYLMSYFRCRHTMRSPLGVRHSCGRRILAGGERTCMMHGSWASVK